MGKKEMKHVQHKPHSHHEAEHHEPSKFSLFKHKIAGVFEDIVKAPPEEKKVVEQTVQEEVIAQKEPEIESEDEIDEDELLKQEHEKRNSELHEEIVESLNQAVSRWKETGDVGVHLEPPVPLRDKVKSFISKVKDASVPISSKLKNEIEEVIEKVSSRLKKAEVHGEHIDAEAVIGEEWKKVLQKMETVSTPSERDEIEKIYKELSEK